MITAETLMIFVTASVALSLAPGPDNIFVLTQSAVHGRLAGLFVVLGLMTGILVHTALVAVGVAAVFQTSALAFAALKIAGAAYLIYLAVKAFRAGAEKITEAGAANTSLRKLYGTGVIMNVTNPKVAIFFLAFLPQFVDPTSGSVPLQILSLGLTFILCTLVVFGGIAFLAGSLGGWLRRVPSAQIWLNRFAGVVFIGLAARLLASSR